MAEKKIAETKQPTSEEFAAAFARHIAIAKQELDRKKAEEERTTKIAERRKFEEERLERYREKKKAEAREKLKEITIEKEAVEREKPVPRPKLEAPIYRRAFPPLPQPPKLTATWPIPVPKPSIRPFEAATPSLPPAPTPEGVPIPAARPVPRPVIIRPTAELKKLDLNKLNPIIADETITTIQCDGANMPLKIIKERRTEEIDLVLSEEEIRSIIRAFSALSGQPVTEPIFTARVNSLQISAQISVFEGTKFMIKKG